MFDIQTFIAILATLLLFLTSVVLSYDRLQFRNYDLPIPQWASLLLAGITFGVLVADQILRGFVRFEERCRILEEEQRRAEEENFRIEESQYRLQEAEYRAREENFRIEEAQYRLREAEYRAREENFRIEESQRRLEERNRRLEERNRRLEEAERQARRTRIETRYRIALIQYQLDPNPLHRRQLADILALLQEYQDTL
ncbi:MAG: hypothetical protein VKN60_10790 [Cyanobacteriota bacterium]|nr:hypothetical protein [Cyanobacteriota bacterium]